MCRNFLRAIDLKKPTTITFFEVRSHHHLEQAHIINMFPLLSRPDFLYSSIDGKRDTRTVSHSNFRLADTLVTILYGLCVAGLVGSSFYLGRLSVQYQSQSSIQLNTVTRVFRYNRTFGSAPSDLSNDAWNSLFPYQGGFFKHPTIAPKRSAFAVFHQLHCLNGIRQGCWGLYNASMEGRTIVEEELPMMSSPSHIRHCIDLIRNSLVRQPDTTIEVKDEELGGVTGFGTEHQRRDWDQLFSWTSKWQTYEQEPRKEIDTNREEEHKLHEHGA